MKQNLNNIKTASLELNIADFLAEYFTDVTGVKIQQLSYGLLWDVIHDKYEADYCAGCSALETNVGYAIDAAWTWFRTGYVNNFISLNPHTKEINLNW